MRGLLPVTGEFHFILLSTGSLLKCSTVAEARPGLNLGASKAIHAFFVDGKNLIT